MKAIFKGINIILSIGLVFIAAGVAFVTIPYFGNQALIVRSGSMTPAIDVGSIAVVRVPDTLISPSALTSIYSEGDIIAFRSEKNSKTLITHRVVGVEPLREGGVSYKTKGDASNSPDGWKVGENNIVGVTIYSLPLLGYIISISKTPFGFVLLILIPAFVLLYSEIQNIINELRKLFPVKK